MCACDAGWTGEDCSIRLRHLSSNTPVRGETVEYRAFNYYDVSGVSSDGGLAFVVNASSTTGPNDCDLFVKYGSIPTLHNYDQRDITTDPHNRLDVKLKGAGTYYLGVFGFTTCHYDVEALVEGNDCPNGCSGHGSCDSSTHQCTCSGDWAGEDCSMRVSTLTSSRSHAGHVANAGWNYFRYDMPRDYDAVTFIVNTTTRNADIDLYLKYGKLPTLTDYDEYDLSLNANFALTLDDPRPGNWYLGVYAFSGGDEGGIDYTIKPQLFQDCTNDCSGASHGMCSSSGCACRSGFYGDYCEAMRPALSDGQVVGGFVDDNVWNYYHYSSTTVDSLHISVNQTRDEADPDCDVYVRAGSRPTFTQFDARSIAFEDNVVIDIEDGQFQTWYIGVFGFQACTYVVSVTPTTACPHGCSAHGTCLHDGSCRCDEGYAGQACDQSVDAIASAQLVSGVVHGGEWKYYVLENVNASYITVHMHEESTSGFLWLFVSEAEFPTLDRNDESDRSNTAYHSLDITTGLFPGEADDFYIGVYGGPYAQTTESLQFKLEAWVPPF